MSHSCSNGTFWNSVSNTCSNCLDLCTADFHTLRVSDGCCIFLEGCPGIGLPRGASRYCRANKPTSTIPTTTAALVLTSLSLLTDDSDLTATLATTSKINDDRHTFSLHNLIILFILLILSSFVIAIAILIISRLLQVHKRKKSLTLYPARQTPLRIVKVEGKPTSIFKSTNYECESDSTYSALVHTPRVSELHNDRHLGILFSEESDSDILDYELPTRGSSPHKCSYEMEADIADIFSPANQAATLLTQSSSFENIQQPQKTALFRSNTCDNDISTNDTGSTTNMSIWCYDIASLNSGITFCKSHSNWDDDSSSQPSIPNQLLPLCETSNQAEALGDFSLICQPHSASENSSAGTASFTSLTSSYKHQQLQTFSRSNSRDSHNGTDEDFFSNNNFTTTASTTTSGLGRSISNSDSSAYGSSDRFRPNYKKRIRRTKPTLDLNWLESLEGRAFNNAVKRLSDSKLKILHRLFTTHDRSKSSVNETYDMFSQLLSVSYKQNGDFGLKRIEDLFKYSPYAQDLLTAAAVGGFCQSVKRLTQNPYACAFVDIDGRDGQGWTPLTAVCESGSFEMFNWLIENTTADPNIANLMGQTPLVVAACYCRTDIVKLLLGCDEKCDLIDINAADEMNDTALHYIIAHDPNRGRTLLHEACLNFEPNNFRLLTFNVPRNEINAPDNDGWTPLHLACMTGQVEKAKALMWAGADVNITDDDWQTPADLAVISNNGFMLDVLNLKPTIDWYPTYFPFFMDIINPDSD